MQVLAVQADVATPEDIGSMVAKTAEKFGRLDVLVNNAGTGLLSDMLQLPEEEFRYNMDLMFFGVIHCSREVIPYMQKRGWGRIINVSSIVRAIGRNRIDC